MEEMNDRRLTNTIYLMYVVMDSYCKAHNLTTKEFIELDKKHDIISLVAECPDIFDPLPKVKMVEEIDGYVSRT